jgi:hypothetical protein
VAWGVQWEPNFVTKLAVIIAVLCVASAPAGGVAQEGGDVAQPSSVGDTSWGLPGLGRIGVAATGPQRLTLAGDAGYGWTEGGGGGHHRLAGSVAAAARPLPWLAVSFRLDGRYDAHPRDALGRDDSLVGDPRIAVRAGGELGEGLMAGAEVRMWVPGREAPSLAFDATTVDVVGLLARRMPNLPLVLAARAGVRLDQSANAVEDPQRYRPGDRQALGVSESHALLLGLGASYRAGPYEVVGEATWDGHLGRRAPPLGRSPLRITGVLRYHASDAVQVEVLLEGRVTASPDTAADAPLVPLVPRVRTTVGVRHRWGRPAAAPTPEAEAPAPEAPAPEEATAPAEQAAPPPAEAAPAPPPTELRGLVRAFDGTPLRAQVTVTPGDAHATTDADGIFQLDLAPGHYRVHIRAEGYRPQERTVRVEERGVTVLNVELRPGGGGR